MARSALTRIAASVSLGLAVIAIAVILLGGGSSYTLHARFADAGQLVKGDIVEVGGRKVGVIKKLSIGPNGLADVKMQIKGSGGLTPLHQGTRAAIRAVGLASITNRYIALDPGPGDGPEIPSGGVLTTQQTDGIVDLDVLFNAVDAPVRTRIRNVLRELARATAAPTGGQLNEALSYLSPALSQTAELGGELVSDQAGLERLVRSAGTVSSTLAEHDAQLRGSITETAATLREIGAHRAALGDTVDRAPAVLTQATGVLGRLGTALTAAEPAVRALKPVAPRLATLFRVVGPTAHNAIPAIRAVRKLLPDAERAMRALPALDRDASPALASATAGLTAVQPLLAGLRPYAPDLIGGFFNGFGGSTAGYYDANGHFARIQLNTGSGGGTGLISPLTSAPIPGVSQYRSGEVARCPGSAVGPASDKSNPWVPTDLGDLCDPKQSAP